MDIHIAFGATENWLKYTRVTITSILLNAKDSDNYTFYILCDNFSPKTINFLERLYAVGNCELKFIKIDNSLFDGAIHDWLGVSSSYRLILSSLLPHLDKILYLDSDIIVNKNIAKLYNTDISDYYIAAVEDKNSNMMKSRVGLTESQTFINAGMQLFNLKKFRKENLEDIIFQKLRESTFYTDQDVINDVCRDKILQLPLRFNLMISDGYPTRRDEYEQAIKQTPVIIHYTKKPWNEPNIPLRQYWDKYNNFLIQNIDI